MNVTLRHEIYLEMFASDFYFQGPGSRQMIAFGRAGRTIQVLSVLISFALIRGVARMFGLPRDWRVSAPVRCQAASLFTAS
jgi:hypothetical protein